MRTSHHAEDARNISWLHRLPPGYRVDSIVGEGRRHHCEIPACQRDGALLEVEIERFIWISLNNAEVLEHVTDGAVAVPGRAFRAVDRVIDFDVVADVTPEHFEDRALRIGAEASERGGSDGADVDHGVGRHTRSRMKADGIEGVARGLKADFFSQVLLALGFQSKAIDERLRDRLDRECPGGIAYRVVMTVESNDGDAEPIRVRVRQLRECNRPPVQRPDPETDSKISGESATARDARRARHAGTPVSWSRWYKSFSVPLCCPDCLLQPLLQCFSDISRRLRPR
jgi:hypothetical protein